MLGKMEFELGLYTNGVLQEGCNAGNATITVLRKAAAASVRDGVTYVYECHSDSNSVDALAAFLIGAYPGAFWGFGGWVQATGNFTERWLPIFDRQLGPPTADAKYEYTTATWTRTFAHALVSFDVHTNKGGIQFSIL